MYNVYLVIEDNEFVYTTDAHDAELVLKVVNPASTEVTSMNAVKYVDDMGFDITELKPGIYPIVKGYDIEASEEPKIDNWEITVTLINLDKDQNKNAGKSFTGKVYITKDDLKENDLIKVNSITSTTTTNSINVDLKIGNEIGQVDKYYFAIEETTEKPEDIQTESVASALAKEYTASPKATYEFTTINEEPLKASQNYKIYGYGVDTKGFRSNIYETIVTTDEYQIPTIESISHEETENTTTLTITGNGGTSNISKYQYSIDNNNWVDTNDATGTITIPDLEYNKSYDIRIRAVDEQGRYSNIWVENIKIIKLGTEEYPYEIKTIDDLVKLSNEVNEGTTHAGEYFKLTNDIDFQNKDNYESGEIDSNLTEGEGFTPIGISPNSFHGVLDGNNHIIKNIYISNNSNTLVGLFGKITNSEIKNLTVEGNMYQNFNSDIGGITAVLDNSVIDNCTTNINIVNNVTGASAGGLVGAVISSGTIKNSINRSILNTSATQAGGIVGCMARTSSSLEINNCVNEGDITSPINNIIGGIIGRDTSEKATNLIIKNSYNTGNVTGNSGRVGGIAGNLYQNVLIENCYNNGIISGGIQVGGIVAVSSDDASTIINKSYNLNNISSNISQAQIGGLMGLTSGNSKAIILNSYNQGNIDTVDANVPAGLVGYLYNGTKSIILNSYNKGNVTNAAGEKFINPSVSGIYTISSTHENTILINNTYNSGLLSSTNKYAIGLFHNNSVGSINNAYFTEGIVPDYQNVNETKVEDINMKDGTLLKYLNDNIVDSQTLKSGETNSSLSSFDSLLADYELETWKQGSDGYPILDYQKE